MGQAYRPRGQAVAGLSIGKTDSGVVSVTSLVADEKLYWPVDLEPYTPAHHFEGGRADPKFRTKLKIASELVERAAVEEGIPFRAVVADSFYGEDEDFKSSLEELEVGYVLALKPSHAWWHRVGEIGSPWEAALAASEAWQDERHPGDWERVVRHFRDGHEEVWWALEVDVGPYGPQRSRRAVVVSTDPKELPDKATWYVVSNLPHPTSEREEEGEVESKKLAPADLSEIVGLYGLRMWVEQSYKQVKHVLGWSDYQVRSDIAIRRHWQLVCCAFTFCWWAYGRLPTDEEVAQTSNDAPVDPAGRGKKESRAMLAGDIEGSKGVAGAMDHAQSILESVLQEAPAAGTKSAA
jgi:SRSO17 transposase